MNLYHGVWVALVTPFKNHQVDEPAFLNLVQELAGRGVRGFVPLGTTGAEIGTYRITGNEIHLLVADGTTAVATITNRYADGHVHEFTVGESLYAPELCE
jgi:dihydrodipicolinate synthase/N-acetylneuraminate lyase